MRFAIRQKIGKTTFVVVGLFSAVMTPQKAGAVDVLDDQIQIDERITQLIQTSNSLCWEMYNYHQKQPDYADSYRAAKQVWTQANGIHDALRVGSVETEALQQQTIEMNQKFAQLEKALSKWGPGDLSAVPKTSGPTFREVVAPGVGVDLPLLGIHVGRPNVIVTEDGPPQLERRRLHANSHGSKRSLERELAGVKVALGYLTEDAGVTTDAQSPTATVTEVKKIPLPPTPASDSELVQPRKAPVPPAGQSTPAVKPK